MAYQEFAYFYDEFNGAADYDALFAYVTGELKAHGIQDGIVADFGCGTGELTLMLAQAGYDMIGIDVSEEMLSVLRDKADALGLPLTNPMLLCQDLLQLDLYGTIRAAVSTFDTYNHIGPLENFEKAIAKGYVDQNSDLAVSDIALKSDSKDAYAVAMPKGSDKLKEKVNKVIAKLKKEGKIDSYVQDAYTLSLKSSSK